MMTILYKIIMFIGGLLDVDRCLRVASMAHKW